MSLAGKRIVVTGAAGFLASNMVARLARVECEMVRVVRPGAPPLAEPPGQVQCQTIAGDIGSPEFWKAMLPGANIVFHFAAQTSVYTADENPRADWQSNVLPMLTLLEASRALPGKPLILFPGTCTQCGLPAHLPVDETQPDRPVTVYDQHKLAAEAYLEHFSRNGWARGATLRLANIYGPGPVSAKPDRGVLNLMMRRALRGEPLTLYGAGELMRDYVFVSDAVEAFLAAALNETQVDGRHFVLASGEAHTLAQAFRLVAERVGLVTGKRVPVNSVPAPAGLSRIEDRNFVGDSRRLQAATGWRPRTSLTEGIDLTLQSILGASNA